MSQTVETLMGLGSIAAAGVSVLAAGSSGLSLGPSTCVPVGAVILLAIASPRDIWQIARHTFGVDDDGGS